MRKTASIITGFAAGLLSFSASAEVIVASHDLVIRRGSGGSITTPRIEARTGGNIHIKQSGNNDTDRVGLFRFDSGNFGANVTGATFLLTANSDTVTNFQNGPFDYRIWGVMDGDTQEELFDELTYTGVGAGQVYDGSVNLIDDSQLINLGDVNGITAGANFNFSSAALLAFLQADTNGTATFVIERLNADGNSTFLSREDPTSPPRLDITVIPEPGSLALMGLGGLLIARRRRR